MHGELLRSLPRDRQRSAHKLMRGSLPAATTCGIANSQKKPLPTADWSEDAMAAILGSVLQAGRDNFRDKNRDSRFRLKSLLVVYLAFSSR
jgi:hypothetical protein